MDSGSESGGSAHDKKQGGKWKHKKKKVSGVIKSNIKEKEELIWVDPPINVMPNSYCPDHEGQLIHSYLLANIKKGQLENYKHTLVCT